MAGSGCGAPPASSGMTVRALAEGGAMIWRSTSVFQSPQSGHLPIHLGWALPQFSQT